MSDTATTAADPIAAAMRHATETQRPTMSANFTHPAWAMSPEAFRAFWHRPRMTAIATVGTNDWPHAAPLEVSLEGDAFIVPSFATSVRVADLRANNRVVLNTWDDAYHAAIVYGTASFHETGEGMVRVAVTPTRIYAIRAPQGHHAHRALN